MFKFLNKWLFHRPKTRRGWLVGQYLMAWNTVWVTGATWYLFDQGLWPLGIIYIPLSLMFLAITVSGFIWLPDYATGKINIVIVPLYYDPQNPKRLRAGSPLTPQQIDALIKEATP